MPIHLYVYFATSLRLLRQQRIVLCVLRIRMSVLRPLREVQLEGDSKGRHRDCILPAMLDRHRALVGDRALITDLADLQIRTRCSSDSSSGRKALISKFGHVRLLSRLGRARTCAPARVKKTRARRKGDSRLGAPRAAWLGCGDRCDPRRGGSDEGFSVVAAPL